MTSKQNWKFNFRICVCYSWFLSLLFLIKVFNKFKFSFIFITLFHVRWVIVLLLVFSFLCTMHYYVLIPLFKAYIRVYKNILYFIPFVIMLCVFLQWLLIIKYICLKPAIISGIFFWEFFKVFNVLRWLSLTYYFSIYRINDADVKYVLAVVSASYIYLYFIFIW